MNRAFPNIKIELDFRAELLINSFWFCPLRNYGKAAVGLEESGAKYYTIPV